MSNYDKAMEAGIVFDKDGNYQDFNMSKVSGCDDATKHKSLEWCETHCKKYCGCYGVTLADDVLKETIG